MKKGMEDSVKKEPRGVGEEREGALWNELMRKRRNMRCRVKILMRVRWKICLKEGCKVVGGKGRVKRKG